ncbi:hypothetical protein EDB84DRAFT_1446947, partial [Lactarius hengduanensis]
NTRLSPHEWANGLKNGLYTPAGTGNPPNPQVLTKPVNTRTRMRGSPVPVVAGTGFDGYGYGKAEVTRGLPVVIPNRCRQIYTFTSANIPVGYRIVISREIRRPLSLG